MKIIVECESFEELLGISSRLQEQFGIAPDAQITEPPPPQPQTAEPPPPPPAGDVDLDANGLPWDERIHAGTKAKNADGTWRNKRGVDKALVAQVEAELKGGSAPPPPPASTGAMSFAELLNAVTAASIEQKITQQDITNALAAAGVEQLPELADDPEGIAAVATNLGLAG